jgi:RNA polymerase sigma factor (sigma-70 family)
VSPPPPAPSSCPEQSRWFIAEVHPHESSLRSYLRGSFPTVRDVDDVVQESFLRVWKAGAARRIGSARGFLFTVARHLALDLIRSQKRSPIVTVTDLSSLFVLTNGPDAADAASRAEEIELLVEAIDSLPPRCREIFILRKLQGVAQKEIARRLGLSEQTVQVQAARGLGRCGQFILQHLNRP